MRSSAPPPPTMYLSGSNWRYRDVVIAFLAGIAGSFAAVSIVLALGLEPLDPIPFSSVFAGQAAASLGSIMLLSRKRGSGSLADDVGFRMHLIDWWGVPAGMALQLGIALVTAPLIYLLFPDGPPDQGVAEVAGTSESFAEQLFVILAVAVAAPIIEEIIFRGMLLSILVRSMGTWLAITVSAAVFSLVHLLDPNAIAVVPGLFLLGMVLGWVAIRRGDLSLPIALHSGINLLAAISLLWGSDLFEWAEERLDQIEQVEGIIRLAGLF